jgi:hypothetical protein
MARIVRMGCGMSANSHRLQWLVSCALFAVIVLALVVGALLQQSPGSGAP